MRLAGLGAESVCNDATVATLFSILVVCVALDIFDKCNRLETAGELPKNIGLIVCEILIACSVKEFCLQFMMKRLELTAKPLLAANYQKLIILASITYQTLVDTGEWLVTLPEDMVIITLHAKLDMLMQHLVLAKRKKKICTCFCCGQEGYLIRSSLQALEEKQGVMLKEDKKISWMNVAPKSGEPEKSVRRKIVEMVCEV